MDGFSLLRRLREAHRPPVLMLTARGEVEDRVEGLEAGADDYLAKPFHLKELRARVRALLRRAHGEAANVVVRGRLTLDLEGRRAYRKGGVGAIMPRFSNQGYMDPHALRRSV
ncbi:hypothetical protein TJA_19970 [Thermus sp. LT1-2-5]